MANTEYRIISDNLKQKNEEKDKIREDKQALQDKIKYINTFNKEISKKLNEMDD